jgi:hypothetical protein
MGDHGRRLRSAFQVALKRLEGDGGLALPFAQAGVYTIIRRKQVEVWAGIRNHVDHGHFDQATREDVGGMLASFRQLLGAELA